MAGHPRVSSFHPSRSRRIVAHLLDRPWPTLSGYSSGEWECGQQEDERKKLNVGRHLPGLLLFRDDAQPEHVHDAHDIRS
jgi:hypothetical protein